jgi:hypothetical protein
VFREGLNTDGCFFRVSVFSCVHLRLRANTKHSPDNFMPRNSRHSRRPGEQPKERLVQAISDPPLDYPTLGQALRMVSGSKCRRHQTGEGADHEPKRKLRFSRVPQFRFVLTTARVLGFPISQGNRSTSVYASIPNSRLLAAVCFDALLTTR